MWNLKMAVVRKKDGHSEKYHSCAQTLNMKKEKLNYNECGSNSCVTGTKNMYRKSIALININIKIRKEIILYLNATYNCLKTVV
jgi:hypothetical protein